MRGRVSIAAALSLLGLPASAQASQVSFSEVEGQPFSSQNVGEFDVAGTPGPNMTYSCPDTSRYQAVIHWSTQSSSTGTVVLGNLDDLDPICHFFIQGSHTFSEETPPGAPIHVATEVFDTVTNQDNQVSGLATVNDASITASSVSFRGAARRESMGVVATLTDANPGATSDDYNVTIDWGDGHRSPGAVSRRPGGSFAIKGSHRFFRPGVYPLTIRVTDVGGAHDSVGSSAIITNSRPPALSELTIKPDAFRRSTTVSYLDSEAASTSFTMQRHAGSHWLDVGAFIHHDRAGKNRFAFTPSRKLPRGQYRLIAVAKNAAGQRSNVAKASFTLI